MNKNWKKVWNKNNRVENIILDMLINVDGFDSDTGKFDANSWLQYTNNFYNELGIINNQDNKYSIYDIGCGSGAFVYPLYMQNHKVGGVDYSNVLVSLANTVMKNVDFVFDEAINVNVTEKYDFVISHSVFHYFNDLNYAKKILGKMLQKANKKIAIFDINDKSKESLYNETRIINMNKKIYKDKYKGLDHLFYDKDWFIAIAKELNCKINIFDQTFVDYANSKLRFNVIMEKND
jgi:2-polyprenyl-3-methyl-5-hydroxy-6-metoxy-1,4-benzoquinol methylase